MLKRYVTGEPEVRRHEVQPGVDIALVLASDGVWDVLSNADVARIVLGAGGGGGSATSSGKGGAAASSSSSSSASSSAAAPLLRDPQAAADDLVRTAMACGSLDNITAVVIDLTRPQWRGGDGGGGGGGAAGDAASTAEPSSAPEAEHGASFSSVGAADSSPVVLRVRAAAPPQAGQQFVMGNIGSPHVVRLPSGGAGAGAAGAGSDAGAGGRLSGQAPAQDAAETVIDAEGVSGGGLGGGGGGAEGSPGSPTWRAAGVARGVAGAATEATGGGLRRRETAEGAAEAGGASSSAGGKAE
jgi:hypothetical protein